MWLDRPDQWDRLAAALRAAGEFGLDTETHGQPDKTSPQHRARVHCWSVGVLGGGVGARGYRHGSGRVLPVGALANANLAAVLVDPGVRKWAHNAPHDRHALANEGVDVAGLQDSLQWLRVACPGRHGYGLKEAEQWALGYPPRPGFIETVTHDVEVVTARGRAETGCVCGARPCRAKRTSDWWDGERFRLHERVKWRVFTPVKRVVQARWDVTEFAPGHPRWDAWLAYSLLDATRGIELVDWIRNLRQPEMEYPWTKQAP